MKGSVGMIVAFFGGAIVGAAAALLLAPESGKNTRRKIREYVEDGVDTAADKAIETARKVKSNLHTTANEK